jgi:hypothetical protein
MARAHGMAAQIEQIVDSSATSSWCHLTRVFVQGMVVGSRSNGCGDSAYYSAGCRFSSLPGSICGVISIGWYSRLYSTKSTSKPIESSHRCLNGIQGDPREIPRSVISRQPRI